MLAESYADRIQKNQFFSCNQKTGDRIAAISRRVQEMIVLSNQIDQ
jgi:hypothetical protein